ncbi:hypothetical protein CC1G_07444 [Coprinopsis cinerea okayama7|uniref:CxC2-like cysteine cluster KDZ transposase-associated domain-containing protein n=1 Tax=Coprinopsis cinerea (strain Okayama-7 / 130 / ATCC MYA-4618 / FGSC 9003) TaxID=240176 RepID=A8NB72_COPC7|nr:hypothetical protein CC1G_07444 [Coprinopsis cinerea okayama7\|eukprot:XP_001832073.2 hypothetical protein CC1G_07444 [Coprinopsis cinerea okayama7\
MSLRSKAARFKDADRRVQRSNTAQPSNNLAASASRTLEEISVSTHGETRSTAFLPPLLEKVAPQTSQPSHPRATLSNIEVKEPAVSSTKQEPAPSQTTALINEFEAALPRLIALVFEATVKTEGLEEQCECGDGRRTVTCRDCVLYPLTCVRCFASSHKHHPLHWAEAWNPEARCFERKDISELLPLASATPFTVDLGHSGANCNAHSSPIPMTLVDVNGIHKANVRFCTCHGIHERVSQLVKSGFFPATLTQPRTAFSFSVLRQFHLVQLEGKMSAYDFCSTLRRLSDNVFTDEIPDVYPQFVVVMQIWRVLAATRRLGQAHDIDTLLPHRQAKNLVVHCPVCPEPTLNIEAGSATLPMAFRHLNQLQLTADGNHHANQYMKNTDPLSRSVFKGRAYFPDEDMYHAYLGSLGPNETEKSTCSHLNAAEKQDRKKFKRMRVTGVVKIDCAHLFVKAMVDLQLGERFANTDYALLRALQLYKMPESQLPSPPLALPGPSAATVPSQQQPPQPPPATWKSAYSDIVLSYDIACGYARNLSQRATRNFAPSLEAYVAGIRTIIPAVHVQNHQDSCMYTYGHAYTSNIGHFHGETAEQYWAELNQLGPQVRQMNNGHRQDVINDANGDWNWKKLRQIHSTLEDEIMNARSLYYQHRMSFYSLTVLHLTRVSEWDKLDRDARRQVGKDIECVYSHSKRKIPSQQSIFDALLTKGSHSLKLPPSLSGSSTVKDISLFVNEGLSIQIAQHDLKMKILMNEKHPMASLEKEIQGDSKKLQNRIDKWRSEQKLYTPLVLDDVNRQVAKSTPISSEILYLPSDYDSKKRQDLGLDFLVQIESELREGLAFDTIMSIQQYVKTLDALWLHKRSDCRGQDQHTRAAAQIERVTARRQALIDQYNMNRSAMISLGLSTHARSFPHLRIEDTERPATKLKRSIGDSKKVKNILGTGIQTSNPSKHSSSNSTRHEGRMDIASSQAKAMLSQVDSGLLKTMSVNDGWIWRLGTIGKLTDEQIREWEEEGDKVAWFRAEAEMERWREQWEIKLVECIRCTRSFRRMSDTWEKLSSTPGMALSQSIFANKQAHMFRRLAEKVEAVFTRIQTDEPTGYREGELLLDYIKRHRSIELSNFHDSYRFCESN